MSDWDVGDTDDPETFHRVLAEQMRDELHDAGLDDVSPFEAMRRSAAGEHGVVDRDGFTWHPNFADDEDDPARPSLLWELAAFGVILAVIVLLGVLNAWLS